jgi:hypothetical protein
MPSYDGNLESVLAGSLEEKQGFARTGRLTEGRGGWLGLARVTDEDGPAVLSP